jgi:hypothetical protein
LECGQSGSFGTGLAHCKFDFDNMSGGGLGLLRTGTALPTDFTQASLLALQKAGNLIVIQNIFNVEDQSSDDQFETSESGREALATKGLFKYRVDFTNGAMFHKVLASLEGNNRWEVIMWDAAGNVDVRETANGEIRGYSTSHTTVARPTKRSGGTTAKQSIIFQLSNRAQKDNQISYINADQLEVENISFLELEGVNELKVTLNPVADGATTITGKIVSAWDSKLTNSALSQTDLAITGATASAATVSAAGVLSITVTAVSTDDVITVALDGVVEDVDGRLFKSNTAKVVVTA